MTDEWLRYGYVTLHLSIPLTQFKMGGGEKKGPPTSFSSVTSTNVRISPQNFLTFRFGLFATLL